MGKMSEGVQTENPQLTIKWACHESRSNSMPAIAGYTARRQVGALVLVPGDSCRAGTEQVVLLADS